MDNNVIAYAAIAIAIFWLAQRFMNRKAPRATVRAKIDAGAQIIDVRTPAEFSSGAYPKAKNVPLADLPNRLDKISKDKPVVLYCASGARSGQALRILKKAGFPDVVSAGGIHDMPR